MPFTIAVLVIVIVLVFSSIKVLNEYERGVMFTLGRFTGIKGPGVIFVAADSGARPGVAGTIGVVGVDVQRWGRALDDLPRDHQLLDILEARQIEHDIEQDALHDRPQSARPRLALDQLRTRSYALFQSTRGVKTLPPSSRRAQVLCALPLAVRPLNKLR